MALLTTVWATDEAVYNRATMDFPTLVPASGQLAGASDGAIDSGAPWTLTSATVNAATYGIEAGAIVHLMPTPTTFKSPGVCWVLGSVTGGGAMVLRRPSKAASVGQPPTITSLTGVHFRVLTLGPQIEQASYDLNRIFGVDPLVSGRAPSDLYDPRQLETAVVYRVLAQQYLAAAKQPDDDFVQKSRRYHQLATEAEAAINLIWSQNSRPLETTNRFSTRLSR